MQFKIESEEFWRKVDLYHNDTRHIKDMNDSLSILGLKYISTDLFSDDFVDAGFIFEIIDEKKLFLAKIKYGL